MVVREFPEFAGDVVSRGIVRAGAALPTAETNGCGAEEETTVPCPVIAGCHLVREPYYTLMYAIHIGPVTITPSIH